VGQRRMHALQSGSTASEGVRNFFKAVLDDLDDPKTPRVCLVAGSMSADVLEDRRLKAPVVEELTAFVRTFEERLGGGVSGGELPATYDTRAVAQLLVTYLQGLFRLIRVLESRSDVERQLDVMLKGLGL